MQENVLKIDSRDRPGFDFTGHMRALCADMTSRLPELGHIDLDRVAIRFCQARKAVSYGIQATLTPLRFEGGQLFTMRRGRRWTLQRLYGPAGEEMLYLLSFYLPRFLEHSLQEKLSTVIHELWHISPQFDGDVRRHPGRCYAHSHSQREYDAEMNRLTEKWLSLNPPASTYEFMRHSFRELQTKRGPVYGLKIATPRMIRVAS